MINRIGLSNKAIPAVMAGVALFLFGCWPGGIIREKAPEERSAVLNLYDAAKKDIQAGQYEEALSAFKIILLEYPDYIGTPSVRYDMARAYYSMGDFPSAATEALKWLDAYPDSNIRGDILLLLGQSYKEMGNRAEAFRWLLGALGEPSIISQTGKQREEIGPLIIELINQGTADDLMKMLKYGSESDYITDIYHRLASLSLKENRLDEAKDFAMLLVRSSKEQQWVTIGRELLDEIYMAAAKYEDMGGSSVKIGCILPLSGPYALYGREILNGIELGMGISKGSEGDQGLELVIRDTKGSIEDTVAGIEDLVQKERVMAIMGPLASATATAAVKKAQELGVPIITFTQKDGITREGDMVFRNYLTPSKEVEAVVNKSIKEMGMKRFGIFYPDNTYGRFMMNLFWDKVEELGGQITAVESYKMDDTDFTDGIRKMVGLYYPMAESTIQKLKKMKMIGNEKEGLGNHEEEIEKSVDTGEDTENILDDEDRAPEDIDIDRYDAEHNSRNKVKEGIEPIVDFDAVFIPGNYQQVALIAPQFPFNNVFNVRFLGTSLWLSDELLETAGRYIQGSIFPVGFFIDNDSEIIKGFVESYEDNFKSKPTVLAANGYDTIGLIKDILRKNTISTRTDFQKALSRNTFSGVTGEISFDSQREVQKAPFLLTVYGGGFHLFSHP